MTKGSHKGSQFCSSRPSFTSFSQGVFLWGSHTLVCPLKLKFSPYHSCFKVLLYISSQPRGWGESREPARLTRPDQGRKVTQSSPERLLPRAEELRICSALCPGHPMTGCPKKLRPFKGRAAHVHELQRLSQSVLMPKKPALLPRENGLVLVAAI